MFCADYLAAFIYNAAINIGLIRIDKLKTVNERVSDFQLTPVAIGTISGFLGACSMYPFDFVRHGVIVNQPHRFIHSLSTVPYAAAYFGIYFTGRDKTSTKSQFVWASISATAAVFAEAPFDKAKLVMMGSRKTLLLANILYVPFAAMLLVMYDKALEKQENLVI